MMFFPEEVISEILIKLPARDLWRFRCVSKSWCALIDSRFFIDRHLNHSIHTNSNETIVFYNGRKLLYLHLDDLFDHMYDIKNVKAPLGTGPSSMIFGSCNGLLLVCKGDNTCRQKTYSNEVCSSRCMKDFGIWNPNTGEYKSLPTPLPLPEDGLQCLEFYDAEQWVSQTYGFGYDLERDDYIVVMVNKVFESDEKINTQVDIHSMKLNSWSRIECVSLALSIRFIQKCAVFASGVLHWATMNNKEFSILGFDIGAKEFRIVAKPDNLPVVGETKLYELKGKLYLSYISGDSKYSDIWIMRNYGLKESWSKLLSIPLSSPYPLNVKFPAVDASINKPLAYSILGNKILLNQRDGKLILHDLSGNTKEEDIQIGKLESLFVAYSCMDSLVRLSNYNKNFVINSQYYSEDAQCEKRRRISFV